MAKRGGNHPVPGFFKVQGGAIEDRDVADLSKQALVREAARRKRKARPKRAAAAKKGATLAPTVDVAVPRAFERAHDREFARMNERKPPRRVKAAGAQAEQPRYLTDAARGVMRRVARVAMAPLALARAVVDRFFDHD